MDHEAYLEMAAAEARHWWFRGRRAVLRSAIRRLNLPPGARILELGSGTGGNLEMLAEFGSVTAVELNETARAISLTKAGSRQDVRAGALPNDLPLDGETFDLICLFDVLEHIEEDDATLVVIRRHLAPGGRVVVTVPAFQSLWGPHDVALHHKRRYEKAELARKLSAAGLIAIKFSFINMFLFPPALLVRLADRLRRQPAASFTQTPPWLVNEVFAALFGIERLLLRWVDLPIGLSLLAVLAAAPPSPLAGDAK